MIDKDLDALLFAAMPLIVDKEIEEFMSLPSEPVEVSDRFKVGMNRIFREKVGGTWIPHPEVDTIFEWIRSKVIVKLSSRKS